MHAYATPGARVDMAVIFNLQPCELLECALFSIRVGENWGSARPQTKKILLVSFRAIAAF
jgi:hypothetical protein